MSIPSDTPAATAWALPAPPKRYWKSPWGYNDEDPPPRDHFFPTSDDSDCGYAAQLSMEDFLQHNCVFYNLINGRSCHSDSYMTGVAYENLSEALQTLKDAYHPTPEEIGKITDRWDGNLNMQPPLREVSRIIRRYGWLPAERSA